MKLDIRSLPPDVLAHITTFSCHNSRIGNQTQYHLFIRCVYPAIRSIPGLHLKLSQSTQFNSIKAEAKQDYLLYLFYVRLEDAKADYPINKEDYPDFPRSP